MAGAGGRFQTFNPKEGSLYRFFDKGLALAYSFQTNQPAME
jgi:hypothetical protein